MSGVAPAVSTPRQGLLAALGWEAALYVGALLYLGHTGWGAREVIWSLWATSLITGGITLLLGIARSSFGWVVPALRGQKRWEAEVKVQHILLLTAGSSVIGLFLLAFFTVHFGMFHAGHGLFLNAFFPLVEHTGPPGDLPVMLVQFAWACVQAFPVFIAGCVLASVPGWLRSPPSGTDFFAPYKAVIKLHLTIIALGVAEAAGLEQAALIVFLAVFFLPLRSVLAVVRRRAAAPSATETTP